MSITNSATQRSPLPVLRPVLGDTAGIAASLACAVHCALMPIVIGYLPALGLSWLAGRGFHQGMTAICFSAAVLAFLPGYRKHGVLWPSLIGLAGVGLLAAEAFGLAGLGCCDVCADTSTAETSLAAYGAWLAPLGGGLLIVAHLLNHQFSCRCCKSGHAH